MKLIVTGLVGLIIICILALVLVMNEENDDKGGQP
jgi:uncharacterized protein YxeA